MGLDSYLERKHDIGGEYEHRKVTGCVDITINTGTEYEKKINIPANKVSVIVEHIGYWRKANAIHHWFTKDQKDDTSAEVTYEDLLQLKEDCQKVIDSLKAQKMITKEIPHPYKKEETMTIEVWPNVDLAMELLPPQKGFFFGSYDIDEWYLDDLEHTVEIIDNIEDDKSSWFIYTASY